MFKLDPHEIKLDVDLPRFRKDMGDVTKLLESIKKFGQLQPVVITRDGNLVYGGRRLAACIMGNLSVNCEYTDVVDKYTLRELELEENIQRKQFTPAEEIDAIAELHKLKQEIHGESISGRKGGWTQDNTAELLGVSRASVIENIVLSEVLKSFPELRACKTKSDIKRAAKGMVRVSEDMAAISQFEEILKTRDNFPKVFNMDALKHMRSFPDCEVDLLLTDPPYGQSIDETKIGLGGDTGGLSVQGVSFNDDPETAITIYANLAAESYRFCRPTAHAYIFVCPEHFSIIRSLFVEAGWNCYIKPMIWIKRGAGQTNQPSKWPSSSYEMILFCRKELSKLVVEGQQDVIDIPIVPWSQKIHPTEKPVELGMELIRRTTRPGAVMYDPFSGSGALLEAGYKSKLMTIGVEIDEMIYASLCGRMSKLTGE